MNELETANNLSRSETNDGNVAKKIVLPGQSPEGEHILSVLLKRTYDIVPDRTCTRAEQDRNLIPGDVHYGDPMNSCVQYETDFVPYKLATDIVLNGKAYAPAGSSVRQLTTTLAVGQFRKDVLVTGDRVCIFPGGGKAIFSDPEPFETIEIRYENAYGGIDIQSDPGMPCAYARNHLGCGFVAGAGKKKMGDLPLPNIEDPGDPLTPERIFTGHIKHWEKQPMPQGFGWLSKSWQPRANLAGVLPADKAFEKELRKAYKAAIPAAQQKLYKETNLPDMDFRFFNGASQGLVVPFLNGNESCHLANLTPECQLNFRLPGEIPGIGIDIGNGVQEPDVVLHTVMIHAEERQLDLVWRGAVSYPGPDWLPEMRKMEVDIQ